jgi:hypothetical protein
VQKALLGAAAGAIVLLGASRVSANGRFPQSDQIVFTAKDPNLIVARTTYGILPSHDNGTTWWYLCEDVLGLTPNAVQDPEIALTASGSLVAGTTSSGLSVSTDVGCNWSCAAGGLADKNIADVVVRPESPDVVLALAVTIRAGDGGTNNDSQVFQSSDDGATWTPLGSPIDPTSTVETIDVAKSDPNRIYVSAWRGIGPNRVASLLVSMDQGQTWTERDVPSSLFDATAEDRIWIGGVDPTDANRVYLRSNAHVAGGKSRLYVTTDAGTTFKELKAFDMGPAKPSYIVGEFLGFALSPDGSKIYFGSSQGGLYVADRATMTVTQTSPIDIHCLATRPSATGGTELWACGDDYTSGASGAEFLIGVSTDDGVHFASKLSTVTTLCGPVACPNATGALGCGATINGAGCGDSYMNFCSQNDQTMSCGTCPGSDGGVEGGGGVRGDAGTGSSKSSSCACSAVGGGGGAAGAVASCVLAAVALARRRRRSHTAR